jgi:hypothetical protein
VKDYIMVALVLVTPVAFYSYFASDLAKENLYLRHALTRSGDHIRTLDRELKICYHRNK